MNYKKMYLQLFNSISKVIEMLVEDQQCTENKAIDDNAIPIIDKGD